MLRVRLHRAPGQRLPLLGIEDLGHVRILSGEEPDGPEMEGSVLRVLDDRTFELSCPAWLGDGQTLLLLSAGLAERLAGRAQGALHDYLQFSAWQAEVLEETTAEEHSFWESRRELLARCEPPMFAHAPPAGARGGWESLPVSLSEEDGAALLCAARESGTPPADIVLSCWAFLLGQNRRREEVCLGVTFRGRGFEAFAGIAGPIARTLPIAIRPAPTLAGTLPALRAALDALGPWEDCFDWGLREGDSPRFAVGFRAVTTPRIEELRVHHLVDADDAASLFCSVRDDGSRAHVQLDYDPSIYDSRSLLPLERQLEILLRAAARRPEARLPERPLHDDDRRLVTRGFQPAPVPRPASLGAAALFRQHARDRPESAAVVDAEGEVSFGDLDAWARRLAGRLRAHPAARVGVLLRPGARLVAAMIAALYAGKPYVVLDPEDPPRRRAHILSDAGIEILLTTSDLACLSEGFTGERLSVERAVTGEDPGEDALPDGDASAYVLYTSGTTGRPKGVEVSSGALANYALWLREILGIDGADRSALLTSPAYDLGYTALWGALLNGASTFLPSDELLGDPYRLVGEIGHGRVTFLKVTPSLLRVLLEVDAEGFGSEPLRAIAIGGEVVRTADLLRLHRRAPHLVVLHHYGPTEATVGCVAERIPPAGVEAFCDRPALGRPIANASIHVLDDELRPVSPGAIGEICVGGRCLATGYLGQPELTARQFVEAPGVGRVYRTGDLGAWGADGRVHFLGRADDQLKVRGVRVDPEGVARTLLDLPALADVAVVAETGPDGEPELVAMCVPREGCVRRLCRLVEEQPSLASEWAELPGGHPFVGLHQAETRFVHQEVFEERCYLRRGISLRPGDVVVDVGANVGLFSLQASIEAPGARIVAIEPAPAAFARLALNARLHDGWTCLPTAVGAAPGEAELTLYRDHSLLSTLRPAHEEERRLLRAVAERGHHLDDDARRQMHLAVDEQLDATRISCPVATLSQIIAAEHLDRIDLLKIDAQRAELDVLLGIADDHWPRVAQVVLETQGDEVRRTAVLALLAARGFDVKIEQTALLAGTDHAMVHAIRPDRERGPAAAPSISDLDAPSALVAAIRRHAAEELPAPLVPARVILFDRLPLSANAKLHREAIASRGIEIERRLAAPDTDLGRRLAALWSECLGADRIGLESHFFELGGHSLLAARLTNLIRQELSLSVSMAEVLRNPRFGDFLSLLESRDRQAAAPDTEALRDEEYPLSHLQARLWVLCQLEGGSEAYNLSRAFRLRGEVDVEHLRQAAIALVARHDALRTCIVPEAAAQRTRPCPSFVLVIEQHQGELDARLASTLARAEALRPFDLTRDILFRARLHRFAGGASLLAFTTHHIVGDGWSVEILVRELFEAYVRLRAGLGAFADAPVGRHRDFVQRMNQLAGEAQVRAAAHVGRWSGRTVTALPFDLPEPARPTFLGAARTIVAPPDLTLALRAAAARHRVSSFSVCVAALRAVIARWTGAEDVVLGTTVSGRDLPGSQGQVGFYASTVLLCARVRDHDTIDDLVRTAGDDVVEALRLQHLPLVEWVKALVAPRRSGVSVLPSVGVTWYEIDMEAPLDRLGARCGLTCEAIEEEEEPPARADLWFFVRTGSVLEWRVIFNRTLFAPETIAALGDALLRSLDLVVRGRALRVTDLPVVRRSGFCEAELDFTVQL